MFRLGNSAAHRLLRASSSAQLSPRGQPLSGTEPLRSGTRTFNQFRGRDPTRRAQTTSSVSFPRFGYVAKRSVCANPGPRTRCLEPASRRGGAAVAIAAPLLMLARIGGRHKSWSTMSSTIGVLADDSGSFRNRDGHKISLPHLESRS
ncbi:hypothetical protein MTO96_039904 [Rhipicephalus appendiculatus]